MIALPDAAFIVCHGGIGFPRGAASTMRIRGYAGILKSLGYEVTVICSTFSELSKEGAQNLSARGSQEGIRFWYPSGSTVRARGFFQRRLRSFWSWSRVLAAVLSQRPALVLTYPMTPYASVLLLPVTRAVGGLFLSDACEPPEIHAGERAGQRLALRLIRSGLRRSDGIVGISQYLIDLLADLAGTVRFMLMPVIIDSEEFRPQDEAPVVRRDAVVYTGRLKHDRKDGVGVLLEAFSLVHQRRPQARLTIVGESDRAVVDDYVARATKLGVADEVEIKAPVGRKALIHEMQSAAVLVTARPDTVQNRAGMPTKLVEYLAAGRPVVATAVGTARELIADRHTGLLVPPDDAASLAAAVLWVLENEQEAQRIGKRGREYALSTFDYRGYADQFSKFISTLRA